MLLFPALLSGSFQKGLSTELFLCYCCFAGFSRGGWCHVRCHWLSNSLSAIRRLEQKNLSKAICLQNYVSNNIWTAFRALSWHNFHSWRLLIVTYVYKHLLTSCDYCDYRLCSVNCHICEIIVTSEDYNSNNTCNYGQNQPRTLVWEKVWSSYLIIVRPICEAHNCFGTLPVE